MGLIDNAKSLRKNSTCMEIKRWNSPGSQRFQGFKFRRQCTIGTYIIDFVCIEKKLIIGIGGGQQNECWQNEYDNRKTNYLNNSGCEILRLWNNEVQQQFKFSNGCYL
ncbi:endonuclease domain-containing protein [Legionella moravica]|uniref:endonuclease domain-containing protein n=1 Tax=Legionella moravica TaxID=39962 RepID=UPI001054FAF8|nr:DUF559 domain-containing protein [Legionella moravica]